MNKQQQAYLLGFIIGAGLAVVALALIFVTTTVTYRSTLFSGKHVRLTAYRTLR